MWSVLECPPIAQCHVSPTLAPPEWLRPRTAKLALTNSDRSRSLVQATLSGLVFQRLGGQWALFWLERASLFTPAFPQAD